MAKVNTEEYGRLSVMTQRVCIARKAFVVPGKSFVPPPKVDSGVVYLESLPNPIAPHGFVVFIL